MEGWGCENGPLPLTLALASNTAYSATAHTRDAFRPRRSRRHRSSPSNDASRHCSPAARLTSDCLTPVLILREIVVGFIFFLLLSTLEVFSDFTALHSNNNATLQLRAFARHSAG